MKLHLPTALRRALLAITALLSPAVVTTTISTATLAAITAPAMADDLTLNGTYEFSGSASFDSVTTGSPNDVIKATAGGSTFTAGIVTIGTGHTLTITNSGYHDWSFMAESLDTSQGGSIKIDSFASMYATGTFYDLYNKIEANSIGVSGPGAWFIYGKGHSDSETTNQVKTSDLFEKLSTGFRTFFNITEGNVIIDKNISDNSNSWLNIGVENGTKDTYSTVSTNVTQLSIATRIFSGSKMEIEESSEALKIDDSLYVYGELVSNRDLILEGDASFESGASVTLNGHTTIDEECMARGILTTVGGITVNNGDKLNIDSSATLNIGAPIVINGGEVATGQFCTINIISSCFDTENITYHYSEGDNGYLRKIDYTVLTGTGSVSIPDSIVWRVDGFLSNSNYSNGVLTVTSSDKSEYRVASGTVNYGTDVTELATTSTKFSLEGGSLELGKELVNGQGIIAKTAGSSVEILSNTTLKSNQLSVVSGGSVELSGNGAYEITGTELSLGSGVSVDSDWSGTVKTVGDTTVSSNLDTTSWKNTELNGTTTVDSGVTLTLGGNTTLGGKITNSGTLNLQGSITVDTTTFKPSDAVKEVTGYFIGNSTTPNTTKSGFEAACWDITIAEGGTIDGTGATWKLKGDDDATFDFESDGTLHAYGSSVGTIFHVAQGDTITYSDSTLTHFTNSEGEAATGIQLDGGTLKLEKALGTTSDDFVKAATASEVEISNGVTLKARQLDASAADVTLSGEGSYTLESGANALNTGVGLSDTGWRGTVNTTGNTTALELDKLGVSGSKVELGNASHTLAARDQEVAASLNSTGSMSLEGKELSLSGSNTLGSLSVGTLKIAGGSTAISGGLTTTGESSVADGANLSIGGVSSIGGKITLGSGSSLVLAGTITLDTTTFKPGDAVEEVTGYFIGDATKPNSTQSGFKAACWDITIAEGGSITDNGVTWQLAGDAAADFDFVETDGTLHAYGSSVESVFHVAQSDTITYDSNNAADFVNSKDTEATAISLNGGTLVLNTDLRNTADDYVKSTAASTIEIGNGVTLKAAQLDTSAADVTLRGEGAYDLQGQELSGEVKLDNGVALDANEWKGTVYTGSTAQGAALDIRALGNSQSTVYLGAQPMRRRMPGETVLESLTAAGVGTTEIPGPLTLQKGTSTAAALVVNGTLTLGTTNTAACLEADSVSLQGLSFAHADSSLVAGSLEGATTLNVQLTDEVLSNKDAGETLPLVTLEEGFEGTLTFNGSTETERVRSEDNRKEYTLAWNEAGTALTLTILGTETYVAEQVKPTTHNGKAGVALMTDVFLNSRPQKDAPDGALAGILNAVDAGTATDRDMAAVAGASTAALGMALSGDVERQLRAIRNRSLAGNDASTTTLVDEKSGMMSAEAPARFFAWVNAEGNRAEQNDDSTAAGYTLTSWGGTLGAGMQVNNQLTLGLALTAMYGDLQSDGPDYLKGDMDTTYVSAFARYNRGKWSHAFIGTAGTMEADYKRTAMGYSNTGDTEGTAFGLMYEVSRDYALSNNSSIRPVFNISYRHIAVDGYSERGTDAALNVGKQSLDTVTVGLGARYAAVVGQQTLNRACGFEARALVKYDLGDRQSTTSTGFTGYATRAGIESAELGAFGVELGAGISLPVGTGSIFADGAVELRSDYTNFNAAVGYRVQF